MAVMSSLSIGIAACAIGFVQLAAAIPNGRPFSHLADRGQADDSPSSGTTTILRASSSIVPSISSTTPLAPDVPFARLTVNYTKTYETTDTETTWFTQTSALHTNITSTEIVTTTKVATAVETHTSTVTQTDVATSTQYVGVTLTATAVPVTERFSETYTFFETVPVNVTSVIFETVPVTQATNLTLSTNATEASTTTAPVATPFWSNTSISFSVTGTGTGCIVGSSPICPTFSTTITITESQTAIHSTTTATVENTSSTECFPVTWTVVPTRTADTTSTITATTTDTTTDTVTSTVVETDTTTEIATGPATTTSTVFSTVRTTSTVNLTRIAISTSTVEVTQTVNVTETVSGSLAAGEGVGCSPTVSDTPLTTPLHRNPSPTVYPRPPALTDSGSQPPVQPSPPTPSKPTKPTEPTDIPGEGDGPDDD